MSACSFRYNCTTIINYNLLGQLLHSPYHRVYFQLSLRVVANIGLAEVVFHYSLKHKTSSSSIMHAYGKTSRGLGKNELIVLSKQKRVNMSTL